AELGDVVPAKAWLPRLACGTGLATLRADAPAALRAPYALDADAADLRLVVAGDQLWRAAEAGAAVASHDPARRLFATAARGELLAAGPHVAAAAERAWAWATLATAAQALGVGRALLERTVGYVRERRQFGVAIGTFQAVKHRLADVLIALEFARPLLHAAALSLDPVEIAMAKVACGEAGWAAARAALQLHGAVGYTEELDLSLWLRKARPLRDAWGTPAACRARVLAG
ncbi:acyl-CoA dehydrogenase family protein, partial [Streptacidiphilus jiangxiensis]